jgi:DNA-binding transcriptional regulator YhcF (GntR family)
MKKNFSMEMINPLLECPLDARGRQPMATQAAELIKQRIKQGIYTPGGQLPSMRTLSTELNVSIRVIQRAIQQLERDSILEAKHGVGIKILDAVDCKGTALIFGFVQPYFNTFSAVIHRYLEEALDNHSNLCVMKSSSNDSARERREIERLIASGINGLLLWPVEGDTNADFLQQVARQLPVVLVDRTLPDMQAPSVILNYEQGGQQIVENVYAKGIKQFLTICDPIDISSFNQLRNGLRAQAENLGIELTILNYPTLKMIEDCQKGNFELADRFYEDLAKTLQEREYQALFCPENGFFDYVFHDMEQANLIKKMQLFTLSTPEGPPHSRIYYHLGVQEWITDTPRMLVLALDLLQDMTLNRRSWRRIVKVPLRLRE